MFAMDSENRLCLRLVALTELRRRLAMAVHESLSQRLVVRHPLAGIDRSELHASLAHRLRLAGCELPLFEPPAVEALAQSARGFPRLIHRIAHYALTAAAAAQGDRTVNAEHIEHAVAEWRRSLVGQFRNGGREWRRKGEPERVKVHDFPDRELGKAILTGGQSGKITRKSIGSSD